MTKEQEEAIENLTDLLKQRNEKQVEITTYDLFENIETVLSMLKEKDKEIEKKDKIIDLMAEEIKIPIIEPTIIIKNFDIKAENKFTNTIRYMTKEEVKQYFESKVEE